MPRTLTASDRKRLIKMASTMPKGSPERKAILAGLAKASAAAPHPLSKGAVIHFNLAVLEEELEEAAEDGDEDAINGLEDTGRLESEAFKNISRMFGMPVKMLKHDFNGNLVCEIAVSSWDDVKKALNVIEGNYWSGLDDVDTGTEYVVAREFQLLPDGPRSRDYYGALGGGKGSWKEWLANNR